MKGLERILNKGKNAIVCAGILATDILGGNYLSGQEPYKNDFTDEVINYYAIGIFSILL